MSDEAKKGDEVIRVLRIVEYVGQRERVEQVILKSIQGARFIRGGNPVGEMTITAFSLDESTVLPPQLDAALVAARTKLDPKQWK